MFEAIKKLFKREEVKRPFIEDLPNGYRRIGDTIVKPFKPGEFEPKAFTPKRFNPARTDKLLRLRYTDTDEILEMPASDAINEVMGTMRPVVIMGFAE